MKPLILVLMFASFASAQTGVDNYDLQFYNVGATMPFQSYQFLESETVCNQPAPSVGTGNPNLIFWDDIDNAGMVCIHTPSGGPLFSVPNGDYEGTLVAINQFGTSGESNRAPFSKGVAPDVPLNFTFSR